MIDYPQTALTVPQRTLLLWFQDHIRPPANHSSNVLKVLKNQGLVTPHKDKYPAEYSVMYRGWNALHHNSYYRWYWQFINPAQVYVWARDETPKGRDEDWRKQNRIPLRVFDASARDVIDWMGEYLFKRNLQASDNIVKIPPRPPFLDQESLYKPFTQSLSEEMEYNQAFDLIKNHGPSKHI